MIWQIDETTFIGQSNAILRYIGEKCGLYPQDKISQLKVDSMIAGIEEFLGSFAASGRLKDQNEKKIAREKLLETTAPKFCEAFEQIISSGDLHFYFLFSCQIIKLYVLFFAFSEKCKQFLW